MNFLKNHRTIDENLNINITPLIDIVFLLLIFFVLTTTFNPKSKIEVNLPQTKVENVKLQKENITRISIKKNGDIFLNEKKLSIENLENFLKTSLLTKKENTVIISADKSVLHGKVIEVMDIIKNNGIKEISIETINKRN